MSPSRWVATLFQARPRQAAPLQREAHIPVHAAQSCAAGPEPSASPVSVFMLLTFLWLIVPGLCVSSADNLHSRHPALDRGLLCAVPLCRPHLHRAGELCVHQAHTAWGGTLPAVACSWGGTCATAARAIPEDGGDCSGCLLLLAGQLCRQQDTVSEICRHAGSGAGPQLPACLSHMTWSAMCRRAVWTLTAELGNS